MILFYYESSPKRENSVIFCQFCHLLTLKLFQTCFSFFLLFCTKEDILKKVQPCSVWFPKFFQISSFVFNRRKKLRQVWNNCDWINDDWIYFFCASYPFKHERSYIGEHLNISKSSVYMWRKSCLVWPVDVRRAQTKIQVPTCVILSNLKKPMLLRLHNTI